MTVLQTKGMQWAGREVGGGLQLLGDHTGVLSKEVLKKESRMSLGRDGPTDAPRTGGDNGLGEDSQFCVSQFSSTFPRAADGIQGLNSSFSL